MANHCRLVIADDEDHMRRGLTELFPWEEWGVDIAGVFADGRQVLDFLEEGAADAVLTDIRMPKLDGLELAGELRARHPALRVVLLSAHSEFAYAKKAMQLGVSEYLIKPVEYETLRDTFSMVATDTPAYQGYYGEIVGRIMAYVDARPDTASLKEAAAEIGFSPDHLSRVFHRYAGLPFSSYLHGKRMAQAAKLLYRGGTVAEAAYAAGYDSEKYFAAAYRRYAGHSPKAAHRKGEPL